MDGGVFKIGVLVMLGPIVAYLILKNPKNSLFMLVATFPMFNIESIDFGGGFLVLSPHKIFGAIVVVLMVVDVFSRKKEFQLLAPHMVLSLLLLAMLLLSFMVNATPQLSWAQRYLSNLVFLLAMVTWIETREEADRARSVFIFSLVFFTLLTVLDIGGGEAVGGRAAGDRFEATMLNANRAARTYLIGLGLALGWLMRNAEVSWRRWMGLGLILLFSYSVLLTGSRAGLIGLVLLLSGAMFLLWSQSRTRVVLVPLVVAGFVSVSLFMPEVILERARQIPTIEKGIQEEEARRSRVHQYRLAFDLIDASPIVGIGPHEFNRVYSQRVEGDVKRSLHSWYLKVAVDAGIPALLLFVGLLVLSLAVGIRGGLRGPDSGRRGEAWGFAIMVFALMVFGVVSSVPYSKLMWLVFSFAAVDLRLYQKAKMGGRMLQSDAFREHSDELAVANNTVVVIKKN